MAQNRNLLTLLDKMTPQVRKAFAQSIENIQSDALLKVIVKSLENGDVDSALQALHLGSEYFAPLDRALRESFETGGEWAMAAFMREAKRQGANTVRARFDARNLRAETFLKDRSSTLITDIVEKQRLMVRKRMVEGIAEGRAPRSIALDVVGKINRATGKREGGIVGLTSRQEEATQAALRELRSGSKADLKKYLTRGARDRRFDRTVKAAIREGRAITSSEAEGIVRSYRNRLLKNRGDRIARTELLGSLHEAQDEGLRQLVEKGTVADHDVSKRWDASEDSDTRESHNALDDETVSGPDGVFMTITGAQLRYPGDRGLGAPASEIINCRCVLHTNIDFIGAAKRKDS